MKSFENNAAFKNLFENSEMEPSFNFEFQEKASSEELFMLQGNLYTPAIYASFDFYCDINEEVNGCIKMDNQVNDAQDHATLANTAAVQTNMVKNDSLISKNEDIKSQISNLEPENVEDFKILSHIKSFNKEDGDKGDSKPDNDADDGIDKEDKEEYIDSQISQKLQMKSSKKLTSQMKRIIRNSKQKRQVGVILERWSRKTDRDMFQYLGNMLKQRNMDLQEFIFDNAVKITNDKDEIVLCDKRLEILELAIKKFKWNNTSYFLFKRLRRIAENQEFSFRESRLLSKILRAQKKEKNFDLSKVEYQFPGKFSSSIVEMSKKILKVNENPF